MNKITPESVRQLQQPSSCFLCDIHKSKDVLRFTKFTIRDADEGNIQFHFDLDEFPIQEYKEDSNRIMSYQFHPDYFNIKFIGTTKIFQTGSKPIKNLLMIERHTLLKSYEFKFPFCIPNSTNSWESIYDMPIYSEKQKQLMILNPWETKSDTYYFIDDELILHERAEFDYNAEQNELD